MNKPRRIAGAVLAGGRSSRMGQNKALMTYHGQTLLDHAIGLLQQTGIEDVFVSGAYEGYRCIPDRAEFFGPAAALRDILQELKNYDGVLAVPVDMPLLTAEILTRLTAQNGGAFYEEFPLPAFIPLPSSTLKKGDKDSVYALLEQLGIQAIPLSNPSAFTNVNAPEDWNVLP
mgnify:CR=1 FL=1